MQVQIHNLSAKDAPTISSININIIKMQLTFN